MESFRFGPDLGSAPEIQIQLAMIKLSALSIHKIEHVLVDVFRDRSAITLRRAGSIPSVRQTCHYIFCCEKSYSPIDRYTFEI